MPSSLYRVVVIAHDGSRIIGRFQNKDRAFVAWTLAEQLARENTDILAEVMLQEMQPRGGVRAILGWYNQNQLELPH